MIKQSSSQELLHQMVLYLA